MDEAPSTLSYCIYCAIGQDNRVVAHLNRLGYSGMSFQQERPQYGKKKGTTRLVPLLPRYVFFDAPADCEPDWYQIQSLPSVLRVLRYDDGLYALHEEDLIFVKWMKSVNGVLDVSQVTKVGTRIQVVGGPLKFYEGKIVDVKKHRGVVAIQLSEIGHFCKIWCPIEYITAL